MNYLTEKPDYYARQPIVTEDNQSIGHIALAYFGNNDKHKDMLVASCWLKDGTFERMSFLDKQVIENQRGTFSVDGVVAQENVEQTYLPRFFPALNNAYDALRNKYVSEKKEKVSTSPKGAA